MTPDQYTNKEFFIEVGDGHQLYVHDWGNPKGLPVIALHGGGGWGTSDGAKRNFDPTKHHVVFFDQRGCGKSLPYGSLKHNTTAYSIEDINKIADHVKFKQFVLRGGSWGACLALAYALTYPERVKAMVLYGIFTGSQKEIDYYDKGEFSMYFPEAWDQYLATVPASHKSSPTKYHYGKILGSDEKAARESTCAYENLMISLLTLDDRHSLRSPDDPTYDPTPEKLEVYFLANGYFMPDGHILNNASKLTMPIWMVQGRYDIACPPATAFALYQKLPNSHLIYTTSGHIGAERETESVTRAILLQLAEKQ